MKGYKLFNALQKAGQADQLSKWSEYERVETELFQKIGKPIFFYGFTAIAVSNTAIKIKKDKAFGY